MIFNKSVTVDGIPRNMVAAQQATYKKIRYISNIFFTTIVFKLLSHELCIAKLVRLVQVEVSKRLGATN